MGRYNHNNNSSTNGNNGHTDVKQDDNNNNDNGSGGTKIINQSTAIDNQLPNLTHADRREIQYLTEVFAMRNRFNVYRQHPSFDWNGV